MLSSTLRLVGEARVLSRPDDDEALGFYADLFARLPRDVPHLAEVTRFVGYQSRGVDGRTTHLLAVEVERIDHLPVGLAGWELGPDTSTQWPGEGAAPVVAPIRWAWRAAPTAATGGLVGEFTMDTGRRFWLSANAYFRPDGRGAVDDSVHLVEPDPAWSRQFAEFAGWLSAALGSDVALRVEHYGSTSIPGIPAKPVIDVLVEVPSFEIAKARVLPVFNTWEWDYWWHDDHMLFVRRTGLMGARTHHVHVAPRDHRLWAGLAFRDHLRSHPADAQAYAALKRELAAAHGRDRERYTQGKSDFVSEILARAR